MNQKGFINIIVFIGGVILVGIVGYFIVNQHISLPTPTPGQIVTTNTQPKVNPLNLPSEAPNAPKCVQRYTTKGATADEKFFSKMDCVPQLDQIHYWESESYFKKFNSIPVKVAVIDSFFNTNHPDLKDAVIKTYSLMSAGCYPINFSKSECLSVLPRTNVPVTSENTGAMNHGTIISGVIAGRGIPGQGMVGINPSVQLILISKANNPSDAESYLRALQAAIDLNPDVISMSFPLGKPPGDSASADLKTRFEALLKQAVGKGIVVTFAAGNYSLDVNVKEIYPTRFSTIDGVISVGARDYGAIAKYSNYGTNFVGISAPGLVISTAGRTQDSSPYMLSAGTSFSGPLVAGAASRVIQVLKSKNISYTPADIEKILYAGSDSVADLKDKFTDGRTLNLVSLANFVSILTQKDFPISLLTPPTPITTTNPNSSISKSIEQKIEAQVLPYIDTTGVASNKTPGMIVGVITKDFTGAFGFGTKSINTNQKPDGDTFYSIGSVSKAFTGLILANEVSQGALNLNQFAKNVVVGDPLKSLIPTSITLRQLVTHTSGWKNMPDNLSSPRVSGLDGYVWWSPARNYDRQDLVACLQKGKCVPVAKAGAYLYSNIGISILGMALQDKLDFASFDELLRARILTPLGMDDTGTNVPDLITRTNSRSTPGYAVNNGVLTATPYADMGSFAPAGEIITTANDMLKFLAVLTGLNTASLSQASQLAVTPLETIDAKKMIGYAVDIDGANTNSPTYSKNGSTQGFSAYIIWKRDPQIGIVVVANKASFAPVGIIGRALIDSL